MNQFVDNIAIYNDQQLDTWSDIIVSFEYERVAYNSNPTGGFALVFFDSIVDIPRNGGKGYSLGYTPNLSKDYCKQDGYLGLQAAFLAIGFDNKGLFAAAINGANGLPLSAINYNHTFTVRGGVAENYNVLKTLNLTTSTLSGYSNASTFTVDQSASSANFSVAHRSVRVILKNHATKLIVQLKDNTTRDNFDTVLTLDLPEKNRASLKAAITNTVDNELTQFKISSFNTAGFPGTVNTQRLASCSFNVQQPLYGSTDSQLCAGNEYVTTTLPGQVVTYTTDTVKYNSKNIIYTGSGIRLTGSSQDYVVGVYLNTPTIVIYKYLGEKLAKTFLLNTLDNQFPKWVDIDTASGTLAVLTRAVSGTIYIYNYITSSTVQSDLGTWKLYQTIPYNSAIHGPYGFVDKIKIKDKHLIVNAGQERVHAFRKSIFNTWEYIQTLSAVIAPEFTNGFGEEFALDGNDLLVGAPQSQKVPFPEPVQGEVYHYIYSEEKNKWQLAMAIGSFYNLNTALGTFGTTIALSNNVCVIGSPGEVYRYSEAFSDINVGRIHVFRKAPGGLFSQGTAIAPEGQYLERGAFFGTKVALYDNYAFVLSPYTSSIYKSFVSILDLRCKFQIPPPQISAPACALITFDNRNYILDTLTDTYLLSYTCQLGGAAEF